MATPSTSSFRPPRKFSVTAGPAPYAASSSTNPMPPSIHSSSSAYTSQPHNSLPASVTSSRNGSTSDGGIGSSLISGAGGHGPGGAQLQNGAPVAANTIANKPAVAGSGLYQSCVIIRERLWCVPGFGERYLAEGGGAGADGTSMSPSRYGEASSSNDPVTQLFDVFRQGTPLCELYNLLEPATRLPTDVGDAVNSTNACKKLVARFIIAMQSEMGFDPDEMFTVMQVYRENTNDWVQVLRVVGRLLDKLEERGILVEAERPSHKEEVGKPSDERAWIVRELLESERKYVQDLEVLQNCARALQQHDLLSADRLHDLFSNLNNLVDFQRRCLINLEDNARRPPDEQRFGRAFQMLEANFDVYWPFCANYARALEVISQEVGNIQRLRGLPAAEGCYLDPAYELPAFLIKPVQRICKYPLLLEQLLKKSDPNGPYYEELKDGLAIVQRGAAQVNEVRRVQENKQTVAELEGRVEDWKGHHVATFGNLLLTETFMVAKGETEREYQVYLFERILLCCKELVPNNLGKKNSKSNSLLKQRTNSLGAPKKAKTTLQLKGRIFINNVTAAIPDSIPSQFGGIGAHSLAVQWKGDLELEAFSLRCKNEEQLKLWQSTIQKLIEEAQARRQQNGQSVYSGASSPVNMAGAGANGRRNTGPSGSLFPQTPIHEVSQVYPFSRADSHRSTTALSSEDMSDGMSEVTVGMSGLYSSNGRGTPSGGPGAGRYSTPAEHRERQLSLTSNEGRPRAMTEDHESSTLTQWRSHSPAVAPPLPRQASSSSASSSSDHQQALRKASSSRQLRQNSRPPLRHIITGDPTMTSDAEGPPLTSTSTSSTSGGGYHGMDPTVHPTVARHRGESNASSYAGGASMGRAHSDTGSSVQMARNRSASTSQVNAPYHPSQQQYTAPPVPRSQPGSGFGAEQLRINTVGGGGGSSNNGMRAPHPYAGYTTAGATYGGGGNGGAGGKRLSNSSNSTLDSNHSGTSHLGSTATSSPLTMSGGSSNGGAAAAAAAALKSGMTNGGSGGMPSVPQRSGSYAALNQSGPGPGSVARTSSPSVSAGSSVAGGGSNNVVRVRVHFAGEVTFLAVLATISFQALVEKVAAKVRSTGAGGGGPAGGGIRLRYLDEDGDRVAMHNDDDVQMAVEQSRATGEDVVLHVV